MNIFKKNTEKHTEKLPMTGKVTSNVATIEVQYLDPDTLPDTEVSETTYELLSDEDFNSETTNNTTTKLRR